MSKFGRCFCPSKAFGLQLWRVTKVEQLVPEQGLAKYFFEYGSALEVADAFLFASWLIEQHPSIGCAPNRAAHANGFFDPVRRLLFVYRANRRAIHVLVIHKSAR